MSRQTRPGLRVMLRGEPEELGATEAQWGQAEVLIKKDCAQSPNLVVNEFIANRLASALGLPVPAGDLWVDDDVQLHWVVATIRDRGHTLPPSSPNDIARVDGLLRARMYCFDALVLNIDRHADNFLVDGKGNAWLIDHDLTLFADCRRENRAAAIATFAGRPYADWARFWTGGVLPSRDELRRAAQEFDMVPAAVLAAPAAEAFARGIITAPERDALTQFLSDRRAKIKQLVAPGALASNPVAPISGDLLSELAEGEGP